ncbi:hypothetical protein RP726_11570 [Candidatus Methylospira mobilis]|uniref:tetratricopeptide repeat protein n=1 Tax=Candidatus Methylospira mobilis TaxID=1808979 RepID=UPI0028ED6680|nr:hypothetical protein [Candidatus Methylospira mobilis]WNV03107.1 hypothetical protein RP726_11570 [Candidatus Methylospira mobilis]
MREFLMSPAPVTSTALRREQDELQKRREEAKNLFEEGLQLLSGEGVERDLEEAFYHFTQASKRGHAGATNNLGVMYWYGLGVSQDYAAAVEKFRYAERECPAATCNLGIAHIQGRGVAKKDGYAHFLDAKSHKPDCPWIALNLAESVFSHLIDPKEIASLGAELVSDLEDRGYGAMGKRMLGACLVRMNRVEEGRKLLVEASKKDVQAHYELGVLGQKTIYNFSVEIMAQAKAHLRVAAYHGFPEAQIMLAKLCESREGSLHPDHPIAALCYDQLAVQGDPDGARCCFMELGKLGMFAGNEVIERVYHSLGLHILTVPPELTADYEKTRAATSQAINAITHLPPKSKKELMAHLATVETGDAEAMYQMGNFCARTDQIGHYPLALAWLQLAFAGGYKDAAYRLAHLYVAGSDFVAVRSDYTRAILWYHVAAAQSGRPEARRKLFQTLETLLMQENPAYIASTYAALRRATGVVIGCSVLYPRPHISPALVGADGLGILKPIYFVAPPGSIEKSFDRQPSPQHPEARFAR